MCGFLGTCERNSEENGWKVRALFDGEPYGGSVVNMGVKNDDGTVCWLIDTPKEIRGKIRKQCKEPVHVILYERK